MKINLLSVFCKEHFKFTFCKLGKTKTATDVERRQTRASCRFPTEGDLKAETELKSLRSVTETPVFKGTWDIWYSTGEKITIHNVILKTLYNIRPPYLAGIVTGSIAMPTHNYKMAPLFIIKH